MLAWGTTGNEAIHFQIPSNVRQVIQQHADSFLVCIEFFALKKMLEHNSAAYTPTTVQVRESKLCSIQCGHLWQNFFSPYGEAKIQPVTSRRSAQKRTVDTNPGQKAMREQQKKKRQTQWWKLQALRRKSKMKSARKIKRTVFTKKKAPSKSRKK